MKNKEFTNNKSSDRGRGPGRPYGKEGRRSFGPYKRREKEDSERSDGEAYREHRKFTKKYDGKRQDDRRNYGTDGKRSFGKSNDRRDGGRTFGEKSYGRNEDRRSDGQGSDNRRSSRSFGRSYDRRDGGKTFGEKSYGRNEDRRSGGQGSDNRRSSSRSYGTRNGNESRNRFDRYDRHENRYPDGKERTRNEERPRTSEHRNESTYNPPKYGSVYVPKPRKPISEGDNGVRLNKYIANSGICSRREADEYISAGVVSINDVIITELGTKVNANDVVKFNGEVIKGEQKVYILMNKPKDYVTTSSDPHAEKTVMSLIEGKCSERVYPVGRLDKNTTGVLLFTNDGELAERLTHPSFEKKKIYQVTLDKNFAGRDFNTILGGITLEDGPASADKISYIGEDKSIVGIEIHSGRNRIVRRIFESLDYKVKKLDRVYFAGLTKKNLRRGQWRYLSDQEVGMLKMGAYE